MRPDLDRQWVLVEQTFTGTVADDSVAGEIPGTTPPIPVTGAAVTVTNLTMPGDPCGPAAFTETPAEVDLPRSLGLYWGPPSCPAMRTGDTLELLVETDDGRVVRGRTEVVGSSEMTLRAAMRSIALPGPELLLNRDTDTLEAEISVVKGRALQLEVFRPDTAGVPEPVFWMVVDSTAMTLPGDLIDFFGDIVGDEDTTSGERTSESVFIAGRRQTVTLALIDERYFDFVRSRNLQVSGRGFINNLEGGMGVFGSIVALTNQVKVVGNLDDAREGGYRVTGSIDGVAVDVNLEVYVTAAGEDSTDVSAFVTGDWRYGAIDATFSGFFRGNTLAAAVYQPVPAAADSLSAFLITCTVGMSGPFPVDVYDRGFNRVGSLTADRVPIAGR